MNQSQQIMESLDGVSELDEAGVAQFTGNKNLDTDTFVDTINKLRKSNKDKWFQWVGEVNGKKVELKVFNTGIQIFRVDGVRHGGLLDINVTKFKSELRKGVE